MAPVFFDFPKIYAAACRSPVVTHLHLDPQFCGAVEPVSIAWDAQCENETQRHACPAPLSNCPNIQANSLIIYNALFSGI